MGKSNLPTDWKIKGKYVYPASDDFPTVCEVMEWLLSEVSEIFISNLAQFVKFMIFHSCENSKKLTSKSIKIGTSKKSHLGEKSMTNVVDLFILFVPSILLEHPKTTIKLRNEKDVSGSGWNLTVQTCFSKTGSWMDCEANQNQ